MNTSADSPLRKPFVVLGFLGTGETTSPTSAGFTHFLTTRSWQTKRKHLVTPTCPFTCVGVSVYSSDKQHQTSTKNELGLCNCNFCDEVLLSSFRCHTEMNHLPLRSHYDTRKRLKRMVLTNKRNLNTSVKHFGLRSLPLADST